jgi:hypothetical protein
MSWATPSPRWDVVGVNSLWNVSGPIPDLTQRSQLAAWWNNLLTAGALNLTSSSPGSVGDKYYKYFGNYTMFADPFAITITDMNGGFFDQAFPLEEWEFISANLNRYIPTLSELIPGISNSEAFSSTFSTYGMFLPLPYFISTC